MRKGLLAEWRRGMASRGSVAALLLAVPVAVAAAIGFEGSLGGLTQGLGSLASGPESTQASSEGTGSEAIDSAIAAIAAATDGDPSTPGGPITGGGPDQTGGGAPGGGPDQPGTGGGTGQGGGGGGSGGGTGGGGSSMVEPPQVDLPSGNPTSGLLDGIGDTLDGVLGGL